MFKHVVTLILANCPTILPTAPAAPLTNTISPAFGSHILYKPKYAVAPGIPNAPRQYDFGVDPMSNLIGSRFFPSEIKCDLHPAAHKTIVPTGYSPFFVAITLLIEVVVFL